MPKIFKILIVFVVTVYSVTSYAQSDVLFSKDYVHAKTSQAIKAYYEVPKASIMSEEAGLNLLQKVLTRTNSKIKLDKYWYPKNNTIRVRDKSDPSSFISLNLKTRALVFTTGKDAYSVAENKQGLPFGQDAIKKAKSKLEQLDLLPDKSEYAIEEVGGVSVVVSEDGQDREYKLTTSVRFSRIIDGIPVHGASRIVVELGENGDLTSLIYQWAPVVRHDVSAKVIKNDNQTMAELRRRVDETKGHYQSVTIEKSEILLYDDGDGTIEPAVHITGKMRTNCGKNPTYRQYVPVLSNSIALFPSVKGAYLQITGPEYQNISE